ncbi:DUF1056 family protein [Lacticaseibacillus rhamnosus]|uniref:DUF1056 family protein n=1 Tax=Lacticaseibacillus rhamnosus TaxID=47715 RepID=UPI00189D16F8|nr:DUF1056 family protein [Lacticaseibacillus rhamnosus]
MSKLEVIKQLLPTLLFASGIIAVVTSAYLFNSIVGTLTLGLVLLFTGWLLTPTPKTGGGNR